MSDIDLSVCHEDDGDMNLDIYLDIDNQISLSINKDGSISWAGSADGKRSYERTQCGEMGKMLFRIIRNSPHE